MQHPFINDLSEKSLDDIQDTIQSLNTKLNFAYRMQNQPMIQQLHMVLGSYRSEYTKRMDAMYKKQNLDKQIQVTKNK